MALDCKKVQIFEKEFGFLDIYVLSLEMSGMLEN